LTLLSTTQVALVRFVNLATGAKVETRFHDWNTIQKIEFLTVPVMRPPNGPHVRPGP
jgi:hypothetical protein